MSLACVCQKGENDGSRPPLLAFLLKQRAIAFLEGREHRKQSVFLNRYAGFVRAVSIRNALSRPLESRVRSESTPPSYYLTSTTPSPLSRNVLIPFDNASPYHHHTCLDLAAELREKGVAFFVCATSCCHSWQRRAEERPAWAPRLLSCYGEYQGFVCW